MSIWDTDWTADNNAYSNQFSTDNSGVQVNNNANNSNFMLNNPPQNNQSVYGPQNINTSINDTNFGLLDVNTPSFDAGHWNQDFRLSGNATSGMGFNSQDNPLVNAYNAQFGDIGSLNTEAVDRYNQQFGDIEAINQEKVNKYNNQFKSNIPVENEDEFFDEDIEIDGNNPLDYWNKDFTKVTGDGTGDGDGTGTQALKPGMFGKPGGFGSGQGWFSRIGKGGEGFMGKFGTGKGWFSNLGKAGEGISDLGSKQKAYDYDLF
jgi:hypothetical protein